MARRAPETGGAAPRPGSGLVTGALVLAVGAGMFVSLAGTLLSLFHCSDCESY